MRELNGTNPPHLRELCGNNAGINPQKNPRKPWDVTMTNEGIKMIHDAIDRRKAHLLI